MIRWLHISDLHLGNSDFSTDELRDELPGFLKKEGLWCDYVFCTGDIKTAGPADHGYTDEMVEFLKEVCSAVGVSAERLFIVPGNHDINREIADRKKAIEKVMFKRNGYYVSAEGVIEREDMWAILEGEKDFINFLGKVLPADRVALYGNPDEPHFIVETEDFNILHVDTTITYTEGQEATDLIVGSHALYTVVRKQNSNKPTILLTHYPFTSLLQDEKKCLSPMLKKNGIKLWLAGHEHDQLIQPVSYLDSVQTGELRYENNASASVLIGEYNEKTGRGSIYAYVWYPQGWAKYPFVDLNNRHVDRYDFELRPNADVGHSKEYLAAQEVNKEHYHRLPKQVEKALLPFLLDDDVVTTLDKLLEETWQSETPHIIMLGDGGMGKTTMLLDYCKSSDAPILYVSAEYLSTRNIGIEDYLADSIYEGDKDLVHSELLAKGRKPTLTLFIDGLNEVDGLKENQYIKEIQRLNMLKGLRIVVSSRTDFTIRYSMSGYRPTRLLQLEDNQISSYFTADEWNSIKGTASLHRLLGNPMMVTVYKEICSVIDEYENVEFLDWILPVKNSTDLFHNYYSAQLALMMKRNAVEGKKMVFAVACIRQLLPCTAYLYERERRMNKENKEFRTLLKGVIQNLKIDEEALEPVQFLYRERELPQLNMMDVTELLTNELRLLYQDHSTTSFPHQMYRDYLSAQWIITQSKTPEQIEELWNTRVIPYSVKTHIRQGGGDYWKNGIANMVHRQGMGRMDKSADLLVENLLECFPATMQSGTPDYSELQLQGHLLPDNMVADERINLEGTAIDRTSVGLMTGEPVRYTNLCMSEDRVHLAAIEEYGHGKKISLVIYNLRESRPVFHHALGRMIENMEFHRNRLFVVDGTLTVFTRDEEENWRYACEIGEEGKNIMQKVVKIIATDDDELYLYYYSRYVVYSLSDGHRVSITGGKCFDHPVEGIELTSLKKRVSRRGKTDRQTDVLSEVGDDAFRVRSYGDGRLVVECNGEPDYILEKGITLLLDAAISEDGKRAATLGFQIFGEKRKVQLWDLDDERKISELTCPKELKRIHLSQDGTWIMGETDDRTWVRKCDGGEPKWYDEHFVTNHAGRLVTYGDNVIRREGTTIVSLNLNSGEENALDCPVQSPKLVCFLPNGRLAAVNEHGTRLSLRSDRTNHLLTYDMGGNRIISIQAIQGQPFIAVFTSDKYIRIYHTGVSQCLIKEAGDSNARQLVAHQRIPLLAFSDGRRYLETRNYFEKRYPDKKRGWWYSNPYDGEGHNIDGDILDISFNEKNSQLVAILANGRIMYCNDKYCKYHDSFNMITGLNVEAYDFSKCICQEELKTVLKRNGAEIE